MRRSWASSCCGKRRHDTLAEARSHARFVEDADRREGYVVEPYRCRFCGDYHVGHRRKGPFGPASRRPGEFKHRLCRAYLGPREG